MLASIIRKEELTMSKDMLGIIVRQLVTLPTNVLGIVSDLLSKMADPEWVEATKRFLRKQHPWPEIQKTVSKLLVRVKEFKQPAIAAFTPAEKFKVNLEEDRKSVDVVIDYVGPDLKALMTLRGVEPARDAETLRIDCMAVASKFAPIMEELGDKAATTFGRVWQMLEKQGNGQEGDLLVNGYANFFLIEDTDQVLSCDWSTSYLCWRFGIFPVSSSSEWDADHQLVSLADS